MSNFATKCQPRKEGLIATQNHNLAKICLTQRPLRLSPPIHWRQSSSYLAIRSQFLYMDAYLLSKTNLSFASKSCSRWFVGGINRAPSPGYWEIPCNYETRRRPKRRYNKSFCGTSTSRVEYIGVFSRPYFFGKSLCGFTANPPSLNQHSSLYIWHHYRLGCWFMCGWAVVIIDLWRHRGWGTCYWRYQCFASYVFIGYLCKLP